MSLRRVFGLIVALAIVWDACPRASADPATTLWYDAPASEWTEALPVGNGRMGMMVFGGMGVARYQFNDDTLWVGSPHDYAHPGAAEYLPELRELLFAGKQKEAEDLASQHFMSVPLRQMAYQPLGDVEIEFQGHEQPEQYRRSLDLDSAVARTEYLIDGVHFTREALASYPARCLVIRLDCDKPGGLSCAVRLTSPHRGFEVVGTDDRTLEMTGRVADVGLRGGGTHPSGMRFASHLRVLECDGDVTYTDSELRLSGASSATLVVTAGTNFESYESLDADPVARSYGDLEAVQGKKYEELRGEHVADHRGLFRRVSLALGSDASSELPTDQWLRRQEEHADPAMAVLLFQYGRYLMIACSRPGSQPANLQGVWNDSMYPPWDSKYTVNINTEMNYWPLEACNLAECGEPLFRAIGELAESGARTAEEHYDARGWVLHHNFDLWRGTAPINASNHGIWPTGGAWLCQHLWWHYVYGGDEGFLKEVAHPAMRDASLFFVDYLAEDPRDENHWLISGPSNSPEHGGLVMGPAMDHQIIRELLANTMEASEVLGVDEKLREQLREVRQRIAPNRIGRFGQLQEWLEDVDNPDDRHRHVSHLWGLFPGSEITPETPELWAAARKSLELRGDGGTGWALAWKINLWARLGEGKRAHRLLQNLLKPCRSPGGSEGSGLYPNLFDAHPPFQIDGNFGATNGICQMLLQAYRRTDGGDWILDLLPALPPEWPEGSVSGLRAPGGFEVSLEWHDGQLGEVTVRSEDGGKCRLAYGDGHVNLDLGPGESETLDRSRIP